MTGEAVRPLNLPAPAAVDATDQGAPRGVLWRGVYRRVQAIHDTWRIDDEWWREEVSRRYFVVELDYGRRLTLYRDLLRDTWFTQPYEPAKERGGTRHAG
ncbi:MAG: DUF6504 family protein [Dehalococcoidia bacterium]